jgi:thiol-disulfide isomerase/thioredoxin
MPRKKRTWVVLGAGFLTVCCLAVVKRPLRLWVSVKATLANPSPPADQVEAVIKNSTDCEGTIIAAWNTGKIIQREVAAKEIADPNVIKGKLPDDLEAIALRGCLDVDLNVREACLAALDTRKDSAFAALASAQLNDCDPQIRLLGLQHLRHVDAKLGIPAIIPVLDDNDPEVAATALKLLEHWTGQDFGVRVGDVLSSDDPESETSNKLSKGVAKLQAAVGLAKQWWTQHQTEYTAAIPPIPSEALTNTWAIPAGDFSLPDLKGGKVRLADYRGKIVVINFWTTWCTACVAEIPELVQLENEHKGDLVVLGVSLDSLPDDDGDQAPTNSLDEIKKKVARLVESKNINYPVFLDVHDDAGGQYNGGELPTTVIVDADGNIRRRFIGSRKLRTFDSMIVEAEKPLTSLQKQRVALK